MAKEGLYEKAKGRARYDPHIRLYHWLLPAMFERLSGNDIKVLLFMLSFEDGSNNGELFMGARQAGDGTGIDKKTALACLVNLDRQGFIRPTGRGFFTQKGGPASKWRFTFKPWNGRGPSNEWREPPAEEKSWGENFPAAGGKIPPVDDGGRSTGGEITPVGAGTGQLAGGKNGTQIIAIGEGAAEPSRRRILSLKLAGGPTAAVAE